MVEAQTVGFSDGDEVGVHLFAARALVGPLKADLTDPSTAIYRRRLTAAQFHQLNSKIRIRPVPITISIEKNITLIILSLTEKKIVLRIKNKLIRLSHSGA